MTVRRFVEGWPTGTLRTDARPQRRVLIGRQPVFSAIGELHGYEVFFRASDGVTVHVDRWSPARQDEATRTVLAIGHLAGEFEDIAGGVPVFVNFTRSYLVGDMPVPELPERIVVEVVESVPGDDQVLAGLRRLRDAGFRVALDDFAARPSQCRMLPYADYVKIDMRSITELGVELLDLARSCGARLVAERVETEDVLAWCKSQGFDLYQGDVLRATEVLDYTPVIPSPRSRR